MSANKIFNGGFIGDLGSWTVATSAVYIASVGNDQLGACHLTGAGDAVSQQFSAPTSREYMIDIYARTVTGTGDLTLTITDSNGNTTYTATQSATTAFANTEGNRVGLPSGTYTLALTYDTAAVYVDDVSVAVVEKTRLELADDAADILGDLATQDAGFVTTPSGTDTEGDYTEAVDAALREFGAVGADGQPDVRYLTLDRVDGAIDSIQLYMLHKLHRYYARHATDFTLEGRTEHWHQRTAAIEALLGIAVGGRTSGAGRAIATRRLVHGSSL